MNLVLVNHSDPGNINSFSGTSYFMTNAIKKEFENVIEYASFDLPTINFGLYEKGFDKMLKPLGTKLSKFLRSHRGEVDFVLFLGGSSSIPYCETDIPKAIWHDSTWHTYLQGYRKPGDFEAWKEKFYQHYKWDKAVMQRMDQLVFSSNFIAEACIRDYGVSPSKVNVIPFGANLAESPADDILTAALQRRIRDKVLRLTFIGKDWQRKGLYTAYLVAANLNAQGIETRLDIVGCYPDLAELKESPFVTIWGTLVKSMPEDRRQLEDLLMQTHFLIHPAQAEPFGIVICEANAYGIPVLGTAVEGLCTSVIQGVNGYLWDGLQELSELIERLKLLASDLPRYYPPLFEGALAEYRQRLNWLTAVKSLKKLLTAAADIMV